MYINTFQCRRGHGRDAPADLVIMETIPRIPHREDCPHTATRRFFGSLYLTADHRQRMKKLKAHLGHRRGRDTPAYFATMYLLTANEGLYLHAANCFCRYGIEFAYQALAADAKSLRKNKKLTAALLDRLVERVMVFHDRTLTVQFKFSNEFAKHREVLEKCKAM